MSVVKTVKITTDNVISIAELPSWSLADQERQIGADCTETVKTQRMYDLFKDTIVMIVDESGQRKNLPENETASWLYGADIHGYTVVGDILFAVQRGPEIEPPENPELLMFFLKDHFPNLKEAEGSRGG